MILELATIHVLPERQDGFEAAFAEAEQFIVKAQGYRAHELQRCLETPGRYALLVDWDSVEHHAVGFRQSELYQQWRALLHPFFSQAVVVEHYSKIGEWPKPAPRTYWE
jgi:heme-degrading monooxygenase HmoA